jgi:selenocysteine lyase/cysteine desulfurase
MLASQRALFDLPDEICYLNAASYGPLPLATVEAAREAVARKSRSWLIDAAFATGQYERARKAAAGLIHADPDDVALTASVSYGVATAAKILPVPRGSRVIVLQDDHSSPVLEWLARASTEGLNVDKVADCHRIDLLGAMGRWRRS